MPFDQTTTTAREAVTAADAVAAPGLLIYRGPSEIDGAEIAVILTLSSTNRKTGAMAQTWILRADLDPITASRKGADASICGGCKFRGDPDPDKETGWARGRGCYVNLLFRPTALYKTLQAGRFPACDPARAAEIVATLGLPLRAGAYGDPVAAPDHVHAPLIDAAPRHTAYTHQWQTMAAPAWAMASADSLDEARAAWRRGLRTFRVVSDVFEIDPAREVLCPASEEAGKRTTCDRCGLCAGTSTRSPRSVAIPAHGGGGARKHAAQAVAGGR